MASPQKPSDTKIIHDPPIVVTKRPSSPQQQDSLSSQLEDREINKTTLRYGAVGGGCGLLFGATGGIIRGAPPALFSLYTGAMWATYTTIFYRTRWSALQWQNPGSQPTLSQKVKASTAGAALAGTVTTGIFRGGRNVIPAATASAVFGAFGQYLMSKWDSRVASMSEDEKKQGWSFANIMPLKRLTEKEYEAYLEEKILKYDVEIALIDDRIAALRAQRATANKTTDPQTTSITSSPP